MVPAPRSSVLNVWFLDLDAAGGSLGSAAGDVCSTTAAAAWTGVTGAGENNGAFEA